MRQGALANRVRDRRGDAEVPGEGGEERDGSRSFPLRPSRCHCPRLGVGTYLGDTDSVTDQLVEEAVRESVLSGAVNVIDTAINYRMQKAERSIGRALERLSAEGSVGQGGALRSDEERLSRFRRRPDQGLLEVRPGGVHQAREAEG